MRTKSAINYIAVSFVAMICLGLQTTHGLTLATWDGSESPDLNWSTAANWNTAPVGSDIVTFFEDAGGTTSTGTVTSVIDNDYTLLSLVMKHQEPLTHTLRLDGGVTLTIDGNLVMEDLASSSATRAILTASAGANEVVFNDTNLRLGKGSGGANSSRGFLTFGASAETVDVSGSFNEFRIGYGSTYWLNEGVLDWTNARLQNVDGVLSVNDMSIAFQTYAGSLNYGGKKALGTFIFSEATGIQRIEVAETFFLGYGKSALGVIGEIDSGTGFYELPAGTGMKIGVSTNARATVTIGSFVHRGTSVGRLILNEKLAGEVNQTTFELYANTLDIGVGGGNFYDVGKGILDVSEARLLGFDAVTAYIGRRQEAEGTLALGAGSGSISNLYVAQSQTSKGFGKVQLHGTQLAIDGTLELGARSTTDVYVDATSAGYDIADGATVTIDAAAAFNFSFGERDTSDYYWGLRWQGDHTNALTALTGQFNVTYTNTLGAPPVVFYDGTNTYFGYTEPPAPPPFTIVNTGVANVTVDSADLLGALTVSNAGCTVYAFWGTNDHVDAAAWQGDATASNALVGTYSNVAGLSLSNHVESLASTKTYYYTYMATNVATNIWATPNIAFSVPGPPTVANPGATLVGVTTARLNGMVSATNNAALTEVHIYFGTSDAGPTPTGWETNMVFALGSITVGATFSTNVFGLQGDQTYSYRVFASNSHGAAWSAVDTFTTDPAPPTTWDGSETPDVNWSTDANWSSPPGGGSDVTFNNTGGTTNLDGTVTSVIDADYSLGSLTFVNEDPTNHTLRLAAGVTLTIDGGLLLNRSGSIPARAAITANAVGSEVAFNGANLHLGTGSGGTSSSSGYLTFGTASQTVDISGSFDEFWLGVGTTYWLNQGELDWTNARLQNAEGVLTVNDMSIAAQSHAGNINYGHAKGLGKFVFNEATGIQRIEVSDKFYLGSGKKALGEIGELNAGTGFYELPAGTSMKIGVSTNDRADVAVGQYVHRGTSIGRLIFNEKWVAQVNQTTFELYASTLNIGVGGGNFYDVGKGWLDASEARLLGFDAVTAYVGKAQEAEGTLALGPGFGSISNLYVAQSQTSKGFGKVQLHGTQLAIEGTLALGARSTTDVYVDGISAGYDIAETATVAIDAAADLNFAFGERSTGDDYWGMRWQGDHTNELTSLTGQFSVTYTNSLAAPPSVFYDSGYTFFGYRAEADATIFYFK